VYVDDFVEAMGLRTLIGKGKIPPRADWLRRHARCGDVRDLAFVCDLGGARNGASLNFAKYDDMQEAAAAAVHVLRRRSEDDGGYP